MAAKRDLRKVVDDVTYVRCVSGLGLIREEVWQDQNGETARYNLAFISHFLTRADNGRVLGYDNSHGHHHRHLEGTSQPFTYIDYPTIYQIFVDEVDELRRRLA